MSFIVEVTNVYRGVSNAIVGLIVATAVTKNLVLRKLNVS